MKAEYMVLAEEDVRSLVKEMFAPDIFEDSLSLEDFQLNLTMLRKTNRQNMLRWLAIFDEECIYHRALRVQGMLETRKTFRLEMQKIRSEKHKQHKKEKEAEDALKRTTDGVTQGYSPGMKQFTRDSVHDDSESSSSDDELKEDSDAEFSYDRETQTAFDNKCNLADLTGQNRGIEKDFAQVSHALTGQGMKRYDSEELGDDENPIYQKWVLLCASIIHMADVKASKLPASYAYGRCCKKEEDTNNDIKKLLEKMDQVKKALAVARDAKRPDSKTFMKQEREDLECTRAAIDEAEVEVEALKKTLADLQKAKEETNATTAKAKNSENVKLPSAVNSAPSSNTLSGLGNLRLCAMPTCGMTGR